MIAHQDQPNHDEANRPDPCQTFTRADRFRKAKFQPARPSRDDSENGEWCVAQLNKKLLLQVAYRMSVCEQHYTTKCAHRGEHQRRKGRLHAVGFHAPLKNRKHDYEKDRGPMLENIREPETFPEAIGTEWPVLGIGTKEQKHGQAEEDKGPHSSPREMFASREEGENAGNQDKDAGPIMVVL